MNLLKWLVSRTYRQAVDLRRHVRKLVHAQRDLIPPEGLETLRAASESYHQAIQRARGRAALRQEMEQFEAAASQWLKAYPHPVFRENVEVLLVAVAVALGVRTFFLQPFKIPTGSMQPTLYGITSENLMGRQDVEIPRGWDRFLEWTRGNHYVEVRAKVPGQLTRVDEPKKFLLFNIYQRLYINEVSHMLWFPPDYGVSPETGRSSDMFLRRAQIQLGMEVKEGQPVVRMLVRSGDHLFVDRLSYNFRHPRRGEIVVFETRNIPSLAEGQYYIKRLAGLGGETLSIGGDQHVRIDGRRLEASDPGFENVYTFSTAFREDHYFGHVNQQTAEKFGRGVSRMFLTARDEFPIPENHYFVLGDNTMNSSDSRDWGELNRTNVIGKAAFVYWPLSSRFGWGFR